MKKPLFVLFSMLFAAVLLVSCSGGADSGESDSQKGADQAAEEKGKLKFGINNWAENVAVSNMWKVLLEKEGYEVELRTLEKAPVWTGIAQGDLDLSPEIWLPITDAPFYEEYKENIVVHEAWYEGTKLGLAVPSYVDIDSLEELNDHKDMFDGRIVGIDAGASLMGLTKDAIEEYGLEYELIESSETAMLSELEKAYNNEEPILVTLWSPHWVFAEYDLKYLEDPRTVFGEADDIYYMTRTGFEEDYPEVVQWMNNWKMDDDSLGSLMALGEELGDPIEAAKQWIEDNRDLVEEWMQ